MMKVIEINNLSFKFDIHSKYLIKNLFFDIYEGDRVYIKGENGTGKTTLLKILIGAIKINEGKIFYVKKMKKIFVPTKLDDFLLPWYSVKQNFNFYKEKGNDINSDQFNENYIEFLKKFFPNKKTDFLEKKIYQLSSGEKAVTSFICSQLSSSQLFFFDELFANTSLNISNKIIQYIINNNLTIIFTSHSNIIADKLCTKILEIENK